MKSKRTREQNKSRNFKELAGNRNIALGKVALQTIVGGRKVNVGDLSRKSTSITP